MMDQAIGTKFPQGLFENVQIALQMFPPRIDRFSIRCIELLGHMPDIFSPWLLCIHPPTALLLTRPLTKKLQSFLQRLAGNLALLGQRKPTRELKKSILNQRPCLMAKNTKGLFGHLGCDKRVAITVPTDPHPKAHLGQTPSIQQFRFGHTQFLKGLQETSIMSP